MFANVVGVFGVCFECNFGRASCAFLSYKSRNSHVESEQFVAKHLTDGTHDIEPKRLDTIVFFPESRFLFSIKLFPLVWNGLKDANEPRLPLLAKHDQRARLTDEFTTCLATHGKRCHQPDGLLSILVDLFPRDLGRIEICIIVSGGVWVGIKRRVISRPYSS